MPLARQIIHSDQAPKAIGPYSQAMRVGDLVFMAGLRLRMDREPEAFERF